MSTLAGALLWTVTSTQAFASLLEDIVEGRDELPSLSDVQKAAVETLAIPSTEERASWAVRARLRGLVPEVETGLGSDADRDIRDSISGTPSRTTIEGRAFGAHLRARWGLGDLVFNDAELRASRESLALSAAIHLARDRATKIYFDRVEVLIQHRREPSLELAMRAARLDGMLHAVTGGRLERFRRTKSEESNEGSIRR